MRERTSEKRRKVTIESNGEIKVQDLSPEEDEVVVKREP